MEARRIGGFRVYSCRAFENPAVSKIVCVRQERIPEEAMKFRPVLLVLVLLGGFYYATTHLMPTGSLAHWISRPSDGAAIESVRGPNGAFDLTVASAAPAVDEEEQQNIAVY